MPYIASNLRLLFSSSSSFSPFKLSLPLLSKPYNPNRPFFRVLSYSKRQRSTTVPQQNHNSVSLHKRNRSTFKKGESMEESDKGSSFGFNKRRAEGKDKDDRGKKNLQLKVRRLNPTNTISYVQVIISV